MSPGKRSCSCCGFITDEPLCESCLAERRPALRAWLDRDRPRGDDAFTFNEHGEAVGIRSWRDFEREPCVCDGRGWITAPASTFGCVMVRCSRCNTGDSNGQD